MDLVVKYRRSVATILSMVAIFLFSCSEKHEVVEVVERSISPRLHALDVATLVSDSGITRYRVNAKEWLVFDKAEEPYWDFPKGIHLERFDSALNVDAEVKSKYAIYYTNKKLWDLRDSVHAMNLQGEHFETNQMFWSEKEELIFSSEKIKITQADKIITGTGFESNQTFTKYVIKKPEGIFPIKE